MYACSALLTIEIHSCHKNKELLVFFQTKQTHSGILFSGINAVDRIVFNTIAKKKKTWENLYGILLQVKEQCSWGKFTRWQNLSLLSHHYCLSAEYIEIGPNRWFIYWCSGQERIFSILMFIKNKLIAHITSDNHCFVHEKTSVP